MIEQQTRPAFPDCLPTDFPVPTAAWADYFGVTKETFHTWMAGYGVPYYVAGDKRLVRPSELLAKLPRKGGDE